MIKIQSITKSTPFARDWFSWSSCVDLDVNLWVACSNLGSSLHYLQITKHLTTSSVTLMTGIYFINCSALLKWVISDFYIANHVTFPVLSISLHKFNLSYCRLPAYFYEGTFTSPFCPEQFWLVFIIMRKIFGKFLYVLLIIL